MRAGDGDDEKVDNATAIDGDKTLFGGAPMPCVVAVASVAVAELLLFIGAPVAPPPRRDDDEPPPGERDRPARPASGSPAGAIDFSSSSASYFFCDKFLFVFFSVLFFFTQQQALLLLLQLLLHRSSRAPRPSCRPSRC